MSYLTTLARVRARLALRPADAADDARILLAIRTAGRAIERATGRSFLPGIATHRVRPHLPGECTLPADLLTLTALTDAAGSVPPGFLLLPTASPHSVIRLLPGRAFLLDPADPRITISGVWGWHDDPAALWRTSHTMLTSAISPAAITIPITSGAVTDAEGETPALSPGAVVRIDDEWLRITGMTVSTMTVIRAVGGTTAAPHALGTPIFTCQPAADITELATTWAARLYTLPPGATPALELADLHARLLPLRREVV